VISVVCLKTGNKYPDEYVTKLRSMVKRNLSLLEHRFICFTDSPVAGVECHKPLTNLPGWWGKLMFFHPELENYTGSDRVLYFDLDMTIVRDISELALFPAGFSIIKQWKNLKSKNVVIRYNSSCFLLDRAGARKEVWEAFSPQVICKFRGDQDWIGYVLPLEETFPSEWFEACENVSKENGPKENTKVIINNVIDNHKIRDLWWMKRHWR